MANILEEKMKIRKKDALESKIKNLKINSKSKLIKNIGHTSLRIFPLTAIAFNIVSIMNGAYACAVLLISNSLCLCIQHIAFKGEWKDYIKDKKNLKMLKQDLEELKVNINLIDTDAVLISSEEIKTYQKYK